jgi:hypothetical protein
MVTDAVLLGIWVTVVPIRHAPKVKVTLFVRFSFCDHPTTAYIPEFASVLVQRDFCIIPQNPLTKQSNHVSKIAFVDSDDSSLQTRDPVEISSCPGTGICNASGRNHR